MEEAAVGLAVDKLMTEDGDGSDVDGEDWLSAALLLPLPLLGEVEVVEGAEGAPAEDAAPVVADGEDALAEDGWPVEE